MQWCVWRVRVVALLQERSSAESVAFAVAPSQIARAGDGVNPHPRTERMPQVQRGILRDRRQFSRRSRAKFLKQVSSGP